MKITVSVTQEHVDRGKCRDPWQCAIALALKAAVPDAQDVYVTGIDAAFTKLNSTYHTYCPKELSHYVASYDEGRKIEPTTFELEFRRVN